ncbi:unnamed protein product [Owenia fusiformis]|uniref:Uncharacterized protein n=1 Tax=Owenia fusiformis TaxID=6347 RepID=A0A8J1UT61_OWEFU|nr:unnamed protein product [Owenia fusiformis]
MASMDTSRKEILKLQMNFLNAGTVDHMTVAMTSFLKLANQNPDVILSFTTLGVMDKLINIISSCSSSITCNVKTLAYACLGAMCYLEQFITHILKKGILKPLTEHFNSLMETPILASNDEYLKMLEQAAILMNKLYSGSNKQKQKLVDTDMVKFAINIIDQDLSPLYMYTKQAKDYLKQITLSKELFGQLKPMDHKYTNTTIADYIKVENLDTLNLKIDGYTVSLTDTSNEECDVLIKEEMLNKGYVWPSKDGTDIDDTWAMGDVHPSAVLDCGHMFANIGPEVQNKLAEIEARLVTHCSEATKLTRQPDIGEVVCMKSKRTQGVNNFYRAIVISYREGTNTGTKARLLTLDYGARVEVFLDDLYSVPQELHLNVTPCQVSLCKLIDVCPPPVNTAIISHILSALANLVCDNFPIGYNLIENGGVEVISSILSQSIDVNISCMCLFVFHNMACGHKMREKIGQRGVIKCIVDCLEKFKADVMSHDVVIVKALSCLNNMLWESAYNKQQLEECLGVGCLLDLTEAALPVKTRQLLMQVMRTYLGESDIYITKYLTSTEESSGEQSDDETRSRSKTRGRNQSPSRSGTRSKSQGRNCAIDTDRLKEISDGNYMVSTVTSTPSHVTGHAPISSPNLQGSIVGSHTVNTAHDYIKSASSKYFIQGDTVPFCNDSTHEIRPLNSNGEFVEEDILKYCCGFLNSSTDKPGSTYYGISIDRKVEGMVLDHDRRDGLKLGMDRLMTQKFHPTVSFKRYQVLTHPVVLREGHGNLATRQYIKNLYVVEIVVQPSGDLYTIKHKNVSYTRYGKNTEALSKQEVRERVIREEEMKYLGRISLLEAEIDKITVMKNSIANP